MEASIVSSLVNRAVSIDSIDGGVGGNVELGGGPVEDTSESSFKVGPVVSGGEVPGGGGALLTLLDLCAMVTLTC